MVIEITRRRRICKGYSGDAMPEEYMVYDQPYLQAVQTTPVFFWVFIQLDSRTCQRFPLQIVQRAIRFSLLSNPKSKLLERKADWTARNFVGFLDGEGGLPDLATVGSHLRCDSCFVFKYVG